MVNDKRPSDFHGLCKENLDKEITSAIDFLDFSAEINKGVFKELADTIGATFKKNQRFTIDDFFSNMVELNQDYCVYFGKQSNIITPTVDTFHNGEVQIVFNEKKYNFSDIQRDRIIKLFRALTFEEFESNLIFKATIDKTSIKNRGFDKEVTDLLSKYFIFSVFPDSQYFLNINDDSQKIPNPLTYFGTMFILSSIVRYKPEKIYKLLIEKNTSINWMLNQICTISARVYPNLMLNLLSSQPIKFSSSSM